MVIEVKGLTKKFKELLAVDNIDFSVKQGEVFAFLGPNGAGKTTTIKMLTTLIKPTKGTIKINGFNPLVEKDEVRRSFGIVFQDPSLDDELTAYENMEFHGVLYGVSKSLRTKRINHLLKLLGLWDRRKDFVKTFSGGMKRRLEIARGLIHHPKILFLDEPTLGLDPQTRNKIWEYIAELNKTEDMTVFFTTHYMEEAEKVADRVAIIDLGKIVAMDTVAGLMKSANGKSVEEVFLKLTGNGIRDETASSIDRLRTRSRVWGRK